jgi:hypothetical protein
MLVIARSGSDEAIQKNSPKVWITASAPGASAQRRFSLLERCYIPPKIASTCRIATARASGLVPTVTTPLPSAV